MLIDIKLGVPTLGARGRRGRGKHLKVPKQSGHWGKVRN